MIHPFRFLLSLLVSFTRLPEENHTSSLTENPVLRARKDGNTYHLDTAVVRLRSKKEPCVVDLVGVVHLGKSAYYQEISSLLKAPSIVLFEMVGGESLGQWQVKAPCADNLEPRQLDAPVLERPTHTHTTTNSKIDDRSVINRIYRICSEALDLRLQTDHIDYNSENFIHADLEYKVFNQLRKRKGESFWKLLFSSNNTSDDTTSKTASRLYPWKFWKAGLSSRAKPLRQLLIRQLGSNSGFLDSFDSDSVILGKRNEKCIEVLKTQIDQGHQHIAILYGSAHLPDLIERLAELGFTCGDKIWLEAWS